MGWPFFPLSPPLPEQQLLFLTTQVPAEKAVVWGSFQLAHEPQAVPQYKTFPQGSRRDNVPAAELQDAPTAPVAYPQQPNLRASMLHGCNFTVLAPPGIFPAAFARGTIMLQGCSEWPSSAPVAEKPAPARSCRKVFPYVAFSRRLLQQLLKQTPPHCHSIVTELRARGQDLPL